MTRFDSGSEPEIVDAPFPFLRLPPGMFDKVCGYQSGQN